MSKAKNTFDKTDFSLLNPVPWIPAHIKYSRDFQCIRANFRTLLSTDVPANVKARVSKAWVLLVEKRVAAYMNIRTDVLHIIDKGGRTKKIVLEDAVLTHVPSIKIQLLAADKRAKGAGKRLVKWMIDYIVEELVPRVGVRFVTVDAYYGKISTDGSRYDSSLFYSKNFDFRYVYTEETLSPNEGYRSMYLDLLPLIEALENKPRKKSNMKNKPKV
jgi:hypothetical protein